MTSFTPSPKPEPAPPTKRQFVARQSPKQRSSGKRFQFNSTIKQGSRKKLTPKQVEARSASRRRKKERTENTFARCFHSKGRVEWVKSQSCAATGKRGNIDNAHVADPFNDKGMGRRAHYSGIVPLSRDAHRLLHRDPERFYAKYGAFDWPSLAAYTEQQWQKFAAPSSSGEPELIAVIRSSTREQPLVVVKRPEQTENPSRFRDVFYTVLESASNTMRTDDV
jgi:hypothetical protein